MVIIGPVSTPSDDDDRQNHLNMGCHDSSFVVTEDSSRELEGFETASEGEPEAEGKEQQAPFPPAVDSSEDVLTDEQLKQRALAQANDAKAEGNKLFGARKYEDALSEYALALELSPDTPSSCEIRSICYANRGLCFSKLGRYEDTVKECKKALEFNPTYLKALIRKGDANEKLENFEDAILDMKKILELDPSNDQARRAILRLEPLAAEKREKMKEEMIGKLKEMGNSLLGRFGMSVDNFKAVKDPNTGSYSINFQK